MKTQGMKKGILFFDIDGTLISDDGKRVIPKSTKSALKQAKENGYLLFINTGRVYCNVEDHMRALGFDGYICGCGTNIYLGERELLYHTVPRERCLEIAMRCEKMKMHPWFERRDGNYFDQRTVFEGELRSLREFFEAAGSIRGDIRSEDFSFDKFVVWYEEGSEVEAFKTMVEEDFRIIDRGSHFFEVVPKGFSKATGMELLLKELGLEKKDSYAFGDSTNDLEMLRFSPNSVAMGNACEEVKQQVDFVTGDLYEDGIAMACRHYGIIC